MDPNQNVPQKQTSYFSRFRPKYATFVLQVGGFNASHQGQDQSIGIVDAIGDEFTVTQQRSHDALIGLGYYVEGFQKDQFNLKYGINAFYFGSTSVDGEVVQEHIFTNLAYHYSIKHYPIYAAVKTLFNNSSSRYSITLDFGLGPNIITTSNFSENDLDGGTTLPDTVFSGKTSVDLSATAGIGIQFNNIPGYYPLEFGYRFFYLGQGHFHRLNDQLTDTLHTGHIYANALFFTLSM